MHVSRTGALVCIQLCNVTVPVGTGRAAICIVVGKHLHRCTKIPKIFSTTRLDRDCRKLNTLMFMCHPFHRIRLIQPRYEVWDVAVMLREWFGRVKPDCVFHKSSTQGAFTDDASIGRRTVASNTCPGTGICNPHQPFQAAQ